MPNLRDIVYGLYGAWRLARLDRGGVVYFDRTVAGFWKSFFAAALVAPAYLILVAIDMNERGISADALRLLVVHIAAYSLGWTVYPVVSRAVCQAIGRDKAYIGFIVAFNWSQVLQVAVYLPAVVLGAVGVLPGPMAAWLLVVVYALVLGYEWFVIRVTLDVSPLAAGGFVGLDLMLGIFITGIADGLIR